MAGKVVTPYQNDFRRNSRSKDQFKKPKDMVTHKQLQDERRAKYIQWISLYRRNPHRFIADYLGIHLFPYQVMLIWGLHKSFLSYTVASRASAKSFIIAVWSVALAILYPGIKIVIAGKTLRQGGIIVKDKIEQILMANYPMVQREIKSLTTNPNNYEVQFHNGSSIRTLVSGPSSRGARTNYLVIEESRLVPREIVEGILKPFLESRNPPYKSLPKYNGLKALEEEGRISYITSAGYKSEDWFKQVQAIWRRVANGDKTVSFLAFDYLVCIKHGIKTELMLKNELESNDPISVQMEYLNIPSGTSGKAFFKPNMFPRKIKKAFYPQRDMTYNAKKNPYAITKLQDEIRMISIDVATRANKTNDLSIISCARLLPVLGRGYDRQLVYMESHKGQNTIVQAQRIKEIFFDFEADYLVLDAQNAGIGIFDALSQVTPHEERGIDFPAMTIVEDIPEFSFVGSDIRKDMEARTIAMNAMPVVFPILATAQLNAKIAYAMRAALQNHMWKFLLPDSDAEEFLVKNSKEFMADATDSETNAFFLAPYVQTNLFIGECVNLDMRLLNGIVKLEEKQGSYKDRYSSVSYMNWVVSEFDKSLIKEVQEVNVDDEIMAITMFA